MNVRKTSNNHMVINSDQYGYDFASIRMNPRDAMVMVSVNQLPESPGEQVAALAELETFLREVVGGKILLELPENLDKTIFPAQQIINGIKYINADELDKRITAIEKKDKIAALIPQLCNAVSSRKYDLFKHRDQFVSHHEELFQFKKANATFVTEEKIAAGLYSARAEREKNKNEFADQIAIYSRENNEFVAVLQLFVGERTVYLSDLIVGEKYRNQGFAQALMCIAHDYARQAANENSLTLTGVWMIAHEHDHLYKEVLGFADMTAELMSENSVRLLFGPAKKYLLEGANRSPDAPHLSQDEPFVEGSPIRANSAPKELPLAMRFNRQPKTSHFRCTLFTAVTTVTAVAAVAVSAYLSMSQGNK